MSCILTALSFFESHFTSSLLIAQCVHYMDSSHSSLLPIKQTFYFLFLTLLCHIYFTLAPHFCKPPFLKDEIPTRNRSG